MKIPIPAWAIKQAYKFVDIESSGETAVMDNRLHEYGFVISEIAQLNKGKLLDVGCTARLNTIPSVACRLDWEVWGIDKRVWGFKHPNFTFVQQELNDFDKFEYFDVVTALSTIEHIGLAGRYGITQQESDGDIRALEKIHSLTRKNGYLLFTAPFGKEYQQNKLGRVYDMCRIQKLFKGWTIISIGTTPDYSTVLVKAVKA